MKNLLMTIENMKSAVRNFGIFYEYEQKTISTVSNDTDLIVCLLDTLYNDEYNRYEKYQTDDTTKQTELFEKYLFALDDNECFGFTENFNIAEME